MKSCTGALTLAALAVASFISASAVPSHAQLPTPTPLYGFQQEPTDVIEPSGPIAQGRDGNLYGTGVNRGANTRGGVFKITPSGTERLLVSFPNSFTEGSCLGLTLGMDGNFYGTCFGGGAHNFGLFYRVTPAGVLTDLYDFTVNGVGIQGAPVLGADGNFYG
ncbi:MAG TPA: choice-of-anchor tandem repeat GloVer-containing protein, partial [Candidatus Polarisedimenticolia bacterium]|nr:choice-of-anchor tandem repeat GloVer-containing protein [Candidatus Polarisedimenticolia bacterium]